MLPAVPIPRLPSWITTRRRPTIAVAEKSASAYLKWLRLTASLVVALVAATIVGIILYHVQTSDLPAFLLGAERVAIGESPYPSAAPIQQYLYAPWLAFLLIPATWVPFEVFALIWHVVLAVALGASLIPLLRSRTLEGTLAAVLIAPFGFYGVWAGHFQPLMICMLVYALPTRWGPVAVGIAASLKVTPIILVVSYAGRGEWNKVAVAVVVMLALWMPALILGIEGYGLPVGHTLSLLGYSPVAWAIVAAAAVFIAWRFAPTRYGTLLAVIAWLAVLPRMMLYDVSALLVVRPDTAESPVAARNDLRAASTAGAFPVASARGLAFLIGRQPAKVSRAGSWTLADEQHRDVVPMSLAPARILADTVDESRPRRQ